MATFRKNLAVGVTVLGALGLLAAMILIFGDAPVRFFQRAQVEIYFTADTAEGLSNGSPILFRGVNVGKVTRIDRTTDQTGVRITGKIDTAPPLPANVVGTTRSALLGGSATLNLELTGDKPTGELQPFATIPAHAGGAIALPKELAQLATTLGDLAKRLQVTIDDVNTSKVVLKAADTVDTINKTVAKAGEVLDEVRKTVGDDKLRNDVKETLANFRTVSENAKVIAKNLENFSGRLDTLATHADSTITKTSGHIDDLSKQLGQRLEQVAQILEKFNSVAAKVDRGEGTAGKLVNDPKLYEALLSTSQELNLTIKDLRRLVEQWEQEGVSIKLGGKK